MNVRELWGFLRMTIAKWSEDNAPRLAAALSYYAVFSIPPILVIVIAVAGFIWDRGAVQAGILDEIGVLIGERGRDLVEGMIQSTQETGSGTIATIVGVVTLLFAATGVLVQLQDALNAMWNVPPREGGGVVGWFKNRFFSFAMILGVGFLLLVSLVVSAGISALNEYTLGLFPGFEVLLQILNFLLSFAIITVLFALLFKYVPDAEVAWRDVWLGAVVTAFLFTIGKTAIGVYLGNSDLAETYGAAASVILILLWVYYSAQILFFGAEFTEVYANEYGSRIQALEGEVAASEEPRTHEEDTTPEEKRRHKGEQERAQPVGGRGAPAEPRHGEGSLLPQPEPSLLLVTSLVTTLFGFVSGLLLRRKRR